LDRDGGYEETVNGVTIDHKGMDLNYFGARYYDPVIGYWISMDLKEQFWSGYSYSANGFNPVNSVDPDGMEISDYTIIGSPNNYKQRFCLVDPTAQINVGGELINPRLIWKGDNLLYSYNHDKGEWFIHKGNKLIPTNQSFSEIRWGIMSKESMLTGVKAAAMMPLNFVGTLAKKLGSTGLKIFDYAFNGTHSAMASENVGQFVGNFLLGIDPISSVPKAFIEAGVKSYNDDFNYENH